MNDDKKYVTVDSGERRDFGTGSVRDRAEGKGRFDLIPTMPIRRLADLYERGYRKYGERNWCKGQPLMASFVDSALRHLNQLIAGEPTEDHAAAVLWNVVGYMWTLAEIEAGRLPKTLDDRPPCEPQYLKVTTTASDTTTSREVHLAAWSRGDCAICGGLGRDSNPFAHRVCANGLSNQELSDLKKALNS